MTSVTGDFELTHEELRVVARYVAESAQEVLPLFESTTPDDPRPRAALDAAWEFIHGARRTKLQRVTSMDAHRAAGDAPTEVTRLAAQAAGDAASAAICTRSPRPTRSGTSFVRQPTWRVSPRSNPVTTLPSGTR